MKKIILMMLVVVLASCSGPQQNPDFEKNVDLAYECC